MRFAVLGAALPLVLVMQAPAQAAPADFQAKADALLAASYAADAPGAAVIVVDDGALAYTRGRGLADMGGRPITRDTVFRLGSITKQFTAAVILQLAEEGRLSLSDPLSRFLPDFPKPGADATVEQLLNHTSGIKSYTGLPGWMASDKPAQAITTAQLVSEFSGEAPDFERGTQFAYNNSGYVLLGAIIEKVTGKPWHQAIDERIVKPLGLASIRYGVDEAAVSAMAKGYSLEDGKVVPSRPIHMSVPHAAGALIGTVGDVARWSRALHDGKVVKAPSYQRMIARTRLSNGEEVDYAFGLSNEKVRGRGAIRHGGGIFGFNTDAFYVPGEDLFVAVFTNSDQPSTRPGKIASQLAALAMNDPYPSFEAKEVSTASLEPLFGVYRLEDGERRFFARDGKLFTRRSGGADMEVKAAGNGRFFYSDSLTWFSVAPDAAGKPVMTIYPEGEPAGETSAWSGPIPAEAPAAAVDRALLERYAGSYRFGPVPLIVAFGEKGNLSVKLGPQPPVPIIPMSDTRFRAQVVDAEVTFHQKDGEVTHLTIDQGGRQMEAKRVQDAAD